MPSVAFRRTRHSRGRDARRASRPRLSIYLCNNQTVGTVSESYILTDARPAIGTRAQRVQAYAYLVPESLLTGALMRQVTGAKCGVG